ncbi:hypothetical protein GCM10010399_16990 [Dactylosporangium fulvum]
MTTTKSTNDTANANFITDHGSIRFRCSRARRGPRPTAELTVLRAARTASVTRAEPVTGAAGALIAWVAAAGVRTAARAIAETLAVPVAEPLVGFAPLWIDTG